MLRSRDMAIYEQLQGPGMTGTSSRGTRAWPRSRLATRGRLHCQCICLQAGIWSRGSARPRGPRVPRHAIPGEIRSIQVVLDKPPMLAQLPSTNLGSFDTEVVRQPHAKRWRSGDCRSHGWRRLGEHTIHARGIPQANAYRSPGLGTCCSEKPLCMTRRTPSIRPAIHEIRRTHQISGLGDDGLHCIHLASEVEALRRLRSTNVTSISQNNRASPARPHSSDFSNVSKHRIGHVEPSASSSYI